MPENPIESLFTQIETDARTQAVILTALSKAIERFEDRLTKLAVKTEVAVEISASGPVLRFARSGEGWRLLVDPNPCDPEGMTYCLKDAPLELRINALSALGSLIQEIAESQAEFKTASRDVLKTIRRLGLDALPEGDSDAASCPF